MSMLLPERLKLYVFGAKAADRKFSQVTDDVAWGGCAYANALRQ